MSFAARYLNEVAAIAMKMPEDDIERMVDELVALRARSGRLFFVGVGGSLSNAHHAVNDFRKLCGIETYAPQASEVTARANDEGWPTVFRNPFMREGDALFVLSVGGGTDAVSLPIVYAVNDALMDRMRVLGIVGRDGGHTKGCGHCVIVVPTVNRAHVTPHTESFQSVILHLLVSHPKLQQEKTKW